MVLDGTRPTRLWRAVADHPQLQDLALGLLVSGTYLLGVRFGAGDNVPRAWDRGDLAATVAAVLLLVLRRRRPLAVLAVATAGAIVTTGTGGQPPITALVAAICAYTVASRVARPTALVAGASSALAMYAGGVAWSGLDWFDPRNLGFLAWTGMAVAAGYAVRTRRAYVAAVEERAVRAEQSREQEARRQVTEERLRIARELHDVVAHHIAMINVQAGVAAHVLRRQPEQAEEALGHVRQAARTVLDELSTVLGVLRRPGEPDAEPTRGLDRLSGLLAAFAAAGLRVEHRQDGVARPLPAAVDLAAFRIVQESLTNAQKYGSGTVRLCLTYGSGGLTIDVGNRVGHARTSGNRGGHGLTGMRERAAAVGGTLHADHTDGGFTVRAFLPSAERTHVPAVRECTERSEGRERTPGSPAVRECTERSEGRERTPGSPA